MFHSWIVEPGVGTWKDAEANKPANSIEIYDADASSDCLVSDGTIEFSSEIIFDPDHVTIRDTPFDEYLKQTIEAHQPPQTIIIKEIPMWTLSNIAIVVLIVVVTTKIILPRLNWSWVMHKIKHHAYRPIKKQVVEAVRAWRTVSK